MGTVGFLVASSTIILLWVFSNHVIRFLSNSWHGLLHGKVLSLSADSVTREKPPGQASADKANISGARSSEPQGQELTYAARISLQETRMQIDDKMVDLAPGMAVTVEITTGRRRIIEYLLSPLMRYKQESLRER